MHNLSVSNRWAPSQVGVSAREAEVLAALEEHLTNAEIAARLFISVRTVESHVSSLLHKLQVDDRRALVTAAATLRPAAPGSGAPTAGATSLPSPLTSFVGRVAERGALADALGAHRLITAVGPGGVGKTRLAMSVATDVAGRLVAKPLADVSLRSTGTCRQTRRGNRPYTGQACHRCAAAAPR
jgi:DNA-binding CsgD family transcriptional regulator